MPIRKALLMRLTLAATAALVLALAAAVPSAEILEQILVKVNGDIVTKTEFEARQIAALRDRSDTITSDAELRKAIAEITPDLILDAVDELLLVQRGREMGYALGDEQYKQIVQNIRESNNLRDEAAFQAALKQEGLTEADLRRNLERQMLVSQVQRQDLMSKISISEEEVRAYYEAHRDEFTTPAEVTLREILIEVPVTDRGINVAQDDEARAKAEEVRARLVAGEPFPRLAADYSNAPSRANGGLIGPFKMTELAPQFQQRLQKLNVGDLTEVMRVQRGYQILKLESRTEAKVRTYEEAREDIRQRVMERRLDSERQRYLDRLREQATITWRNEELRKAYEAALARRRAEAANHAAR
jgi:peptidyl-prolyl cis-trans isomerase SurA